MVGKRWRDNRKRRGKERKNYGKQQKKKRKSRGRKMIIYRILI
jgi:hypothetical protein